MAQSRTQRIESEIQRVLAALIAREVKDPRVGNVTITGVSVASDMGSARVFFTPFASRNPPEQVATGLARAAGYLRGELGRRLGLRHAPKLEFVFDDDTAHPRVIPSCDKTSVSIATSLPRALNEGPSHFDGQALVKFQRTTSVRLSRSYMTIEPCRTSIVPSMIDCRHAHSSADAVRPRLRVMTPTASNVNAMTRMRSILVINPDNG